MKGFEPSPYKFSRTSNTGFFICISSWTVWPNIHMSNFCGANKTKCPLTKLPDFCISQVLFLNSPKIHIQQVLFFSVRLYGKLMSESTTAFIYLYVIQWCKKKCFLVQHFMRSHCRQVDKWTICSMISGPALHTWSHCRQVDKRTICSMIDLFMKLSLPGQLCCNTAATDLDIATMKLSPGKWVVTLMHCSIHMK